MAEKKTCIGDLLEYLDSLHIKYVFSGDRDTFLEGFSAIDRYKPGTATWMKKSMDTDVSVREAALLVLQEGCTPTGKNFLVTAESKRAFFSIIEKFFCKEKPVQNHIGQNTFISSEVKLGKNCMIGNNCVLDGDITIEDNVVIEHNVVILNKVHIGARTVIQSNTVIGEDGFGYMKDENNHRVMIRHYGGVEIGEDVFIACHVNISRGTIGDTVIGRHTKLAAFVTIAHNVVLGEDNVAICSDFYGSSKTGDNTYVVGSIVRNQKKIGNNVIVGMGTVVTDDIPDGVCVVGAPARTINSTEDL